MDRTTTTARHPPERGRVLLAGATGFIGQHVYPALTAAGYSVRCGSRRPGRAANAFPDRDWVRLDVEDAASVVQAMEGCEAVLYLVHQMGGGAGYAEREAHAAKVTRECAAAAGVERILYLGGVAPEGRCSPHLQSRLQTGATLRAGRVPTVELRAGMIIGAGSASWTIVRDLAARLPAMLLPRWLHNHSSPVAIDDVVAAILWAVRAAPARSGWYDVPGDEVISHRALIERVAAVLGKHPAIVEVPIVTPRLSSYWIALVTRTDLDLARELVQGLQSELIPSGTSVWSQYRRQPLGIEHAAQIALADEVTAHTSSPAADARLAAIGASFGRPAMV